MLVLVRRACIHSHMHIHLHLHMLRLGLLAHQRRLEGGRSKVDSRRSKVRSVRQISRTDAL